MSRRQGAIPIRVLAGAAALTLIGPATSAAACSGRIRSADVTPTIRYDGFAPTETSTINDVRIDNTGSDDCAYWLAFYRNPTAPARLGGQIVYELRSLAGLELLTNRPPTVAPDRFLATGVVRDGQTSRVEYQWRLLRGQVVPAGTYADTVDLRLFDAGTNALLDTRTLTLTAAVEASVSINLAGANVSSPHNYTMDFGSLETGETKSVQIQVRSNQRFRLDVASTHGGRMQLTPPSGSWWVDYLAALDGRTLHFPDSLGPFDATTVNGANLQFQVTIGDVTGKRAGTYRDEVTISIVPAT
jgi:hypothetical protein